MILHGYAVVNTRAPSYRPVVIRYCITYYGCKRQLFVLLYKIIKKILYLKPKEIYGLFSYIITVVQH